MKIWKSTIFAAWLTALVLPAAATEYPAMLLKYSASVPQSLNTSKIDTYFSSELERRSGGKIKVQHFWSNALGTEAEVVDLTGSGAIDLAMIVTGSQYSRMPFASLTNSVPLTFADGPKLLNLTRDIFENNETIKAEFAAANLQPILYRYLPDYRIYCNKPIRALADFKNLKIRSYGAYVPAAFEALGAVPVNIPPIEMIQAMKSGALDCTYFFDSAVPFFKIHQAAKYGTDISFGVINGVTVFTSKDNWDNKWPEEVKQLIMEVAADTEAYGNKLLAEDEANAVAAMEEAGMEIVHFEEMDALRKAVPDMLELWAGRMDELGKGSEAAELVEYIRANR